MTLPLAGAGTLKSVPRHQFRAKALLGAAVVTAFASVFSSSPAQAATETTCASPIAISLPGFLSVTNIVCGGDAFNRSDVKIELDTAGLAYIFSGSLTPGLANGFISYDIAIDPLTGQEFQWVQLSAEGSFAEYTVTKDVAWAGGGSTQLLTSDVAVPSAPTFSFAPFPSLKSLSVKDTWLATSGTVIDVNNGYLLTPARDEGDPVPGPLPIVGAAACFGLSRKLRSRIKASNVVS
ncbi:hypothetical protein [Synechococcus sp. BA-132 BA5]|uniref:hypothetical protein n=1 Tax=Synechococcus sp. BA-132 BA5 TaxID=3110252 RepID=UPI002B206810|nr:hypothetical protein [Synechococcus sp. BA-132 BA5]MEA5415742.1 hypothetical protein [Synechococcus sp. BA-132 BA5]